MKADRRELLGRWLPTTPGASGGDIARTWLCRITAFLLTLLMSLGGPLQQSAADRGPTGFGQRAQLAVFSFSQFAFDSRSGSTASGWFGMRLPHAAGAEGGGNTTDAGSELSAAAALGLANLDRSPIVGLLASIHFEAECARRGMHTAGRDPPVV